MRSKRRKFITGVSVGTVAGVGGAKWIKPVVDTVVLPAHAQVSPVAQLGVRVTVSGNDFTTSGRVFSDGTHNILSDNPGDIDNLNLLYRAGIDPNQNQTIPITATINVSGDFNPAGIVGPIGTQTVNADPSNNRDQTATFPTIDIDANGPLVVIDAQFTTPSGLSRRIRLNVTNI